jgi:hypothetical protein
MAGEKVADKRRAARSNRVELENLYARICTHFFLCKKNAALYPANHPLVLRSAKTLQEDLGLYFDKAGQPFSLHTSETIENPGGEKEQVSAEEIVVLRRLIKRHLIQTFTVFPDVTEDELFEFCVLLRDDLLSKSEGEDRDIVNTTSWKHIRIQFYEPEDLPDWAPDDKTMLELAAGVHKVKGLSDWLKSLDANVREPVRQTLLKPEFLRQIAELRTSFRARVNSRADGGDGKVDLIGEILRSVAPPPGTLENPEATAQEITTNLDRIVRFLRENKEILAGQTRAYSEAGDVDGIIKRLRDNFQAALIPHGNSRTLQLQRHRLAFLFRTEPQSQANSGAIDGADASLTPLAPLKPTATECVPGKHAEARNVEQKDSSFVETFKSTSYDLNLLRDSVLNTDWRERYLKTVLELLATEKSREKVRGRFTTIVKTLHAHGKDKNSLLDSIVDVSTFVGETKVAEGEELLAEILGAIDAPEEVAGLIELTALPLVGLESTSAVLVHLSHADPQKSLLVQRSNRSPLKTVADDRLDLLALAPALIAIWAKSDPKCFTRPEMKDVLKGQAPEHIQNTFRDYVSRHNPQQVVEFLVGIPAGTWGGEYILFEALQHGLPEVRRCGILQLQKFRTPVVVATLAEILNKNNYVTRPCMPDVEAALRALIVIGDRQAQKVLELVPRRRGWMRYYFRKQIRNALSEIRRERGAT